LVFSLIEDIVGPKNSVEGQRPETKGNSRRIWAFGTCFVSTGERSLEVTGFANTWVGRFLFV
jgi:hypothetical protein